MSIRKVSKRKNQKGQARDDAEQRIVQAFSREPSNYSRRMSKHLNKDDGDEDEQSPWIDRWFMEISAIKATPNQVTNTKRQSFRRANHDGGKKQKKSKRSNTGRRNKNTTSRKNKDVNNTSVVEEEDKMLEELIVSASNLEHGKDVVLEEIYRGRSSISSDHSDSLKRLNKSAKSKNQEIQSPQRKGLKQKMSENIFKTSLILMMECVRGKRSVLNAKRKKRKKKKQKKETRIQLW